MCVFSWLHVTCPHQHNPVDVFQAKDAIMELQPTCEFWDFLYHLVDVSIVADIFVGIVPGTFKHHLRLVLELLFWWNLLTENEVKGIWRFHTRSCAHWCYNCTAAVAWTLESQQGDGCTTVKYLTADLSLADAPWYRHSPDRTRKVLSCSSDVKQEDRQGCPHPGTQAIFDQWKMLNKKLKAVKAGRRMVRPFVLPLSHGLTIRWSNRPIGLTVQLV